MQNIWIFIFGALMIYVAWWLICAIRDHIAFEVEMGLGVGSLWAAGFAPGFLARQSPRWRGGHSPVPASVCL
jgi:hypothetical protein